MNFLFLCFLFFSLTARASVLSEDFTSLDKKDNSTLVWNFELGLLHTTPLIYGYRNSSQVIASQTTFSVSDGSHGSFEPSTYSQFGTIVGNHITINATQFPILKLSRFYLDSTHTLSSVNGPLVIHSLSTVRIDGVITCYGDNGGAANSNLGGDEGVGRCGGRSGGRGGDAASSGSDGQPTTGTVTGGGGAIYTGATPGAGGGGGAGYVGLNGGIGENSNPAANAGGNPGSGFSGIDHGFINLNGSAGGGGGSGSGSEGGGGGGAGGGTVVIHAVSGVTISNTGAILAYGGAGGSANDGGGGGGGAGGNVKILTPAKFQIATGGIINVSAGASSTPTNANAGIGGAGSIGRVWYVAGSYAVSGTISHGSTLANKGLTGFVSGTTQTATSKSFDSGSDISTFISIATYPESNDVTIQVSGSDDDFINDDSGWINAAAISGIADKRYLKYRLNLNNTDALNPTFIDRVTITYDPGQKEIFAFKSAGCGLTKDVKSESFSTSAFTLMLLPFLLLWKLRRLKIAPSQLKK